MNPQVKFLILLIVFTTVVYSPAVKNEFNNWDDDAYFISNTQIALTKENIKKSFTQGETHRMYVPLTALTNSITFRLFGLRCKPILIINILFHLLNIILVFLLITKFEASNYTALYCSALFALHPVQVESIAYASGRRDILYVFFFLLSILFYVHSTKKQIFPNLFYFLSILFALCSMLSKGQGIVLPFVLILVDWFIRNNLRNRQVWLNKIPYLILSVFIGIMIYRAPQFATGNFINSSYLSNEIPMYNRFVYAGFALLQYLIQLVFPMNLSLIHPYPIENGEYSIPLSYHVYIIVDFILAFVIYKFLRKDKILIMGFAFYLLNIGMLLQLIPNSYGILNDHYLYFSGIGLFFIASEKINAIKFGKFEHAGQIIFVICIIILSVLTFQRIAVFKNSISVWTDVLKKYPGEPYACYNRGVAFDNKGQYEKALADYNTALEYNPSFTKVLLNRSIILDRMGQSKEALANLDQLLMFDTLSPQPYMNRGIVRSKLGMQKYAVDDFDRAILLKPGYEIAYFNRALTKQTLTDFSGALNDFNEAIKLNSHNHYYFFRRGAVKRMLNDYNGALHDFNRSIELKRDFLDVYAERALCFYLIKDYDRCINDCEFYLQSNPSNPNVVKLHQQAIASRPLSINKTGKKN